MVAQVVDQAPVALGVDCGVTVDRIAIAHVVDQDPTDGVITKNDVTWLDLFKKTM